MSDFRTKVLVGNIVINPAVLRRYLAKSHYFLTYAPEKETLTVSANHGSGGETLFEIRDISYESAAKLAEGLGCTGDGNSEYPLTWSKWVPVLHLHHDGSGDAESLRAEMHKLGIPHTVIRGEETLAIQDGQFIYKLPHWTHAQMLGVIRETAQRYKECLGTP